VIDHNAIQTALHAKLFDLSVVTSTGTFSATATGYARTSGSFLTDGFRPGMEVAGTGFSESANNAAKTILRATALTLSCSGCTAESAGTRTLTVGLPAGRAWENVEYTPVPGDPYIEEAYIPGPMDALTLGDTPTLECSPSYIIRVYVPINTGPEAARQYADALLTLFAPKTSLTVTDHTLTVRTRPAPYSGQLIRTEAGHATLPVTVPLRARTANSI